MNKINLAIGGFFAVLTASVFLGSWYQVQEVERTVVLRAGAFSKVSEPGLNFKLPYVDTIIDIPVQTRTLTLHGDAVEAYSFDQQPADMKLSLSYRISTNKDHIRDFYQSFAGDPVAFETRVLQPVMLRELKIVFGQFTAQKAIQDRDDLNRRIQEQIIKSIGEYVVITNVNVENIEFSAAYIKSIEEKQLAEVEVLKIRQNAEREKVQAEIVVTKAKAEADAVRARATAEAEAIRLKGSAEAEAIAARGKAVRENTGLVELQAVEKWDGKLPVTMVPNSAVPFIGVK